MAEHFSTYSERGLECPYCGYLDEDPDLFDEDGDSDWECDNCEKHFSVHVKYSLTYRCEPSCSLNNSVCYYYPDPIFCAVCNGMKPKES